MFIVPGHTHPAMRMGSRAVTAGAELEEVGWDKEDEAGGNQVVGEEEE